MISPLPKYYWYSLKIIVELSNTITIGQPQILANGGVVRFVLVCFYWVGKQPRFIVTVEES
jgi:hypothetical protein